MSEFSKRSKFKTKEQCAAGASSKTTVSQEAQTIRYQTCRMVQTAINRVLDSNAAASKVQGMETLAIAQGELLLGMEKLLADFKKATEKL